MVTLQQMKCFRELAKARHLHHPDHIEQYDHQSGKAAGAPAL